MNNNDKTLVWFGDSWSVGDELGYHYGPFDTHDYDDKILSLHWLERYRSRPDLAFPFLVSQKLGIDFLIYAANARSISRIYYDLIDFIKKHKRENQTYIAVFSLPTQYSRCFYVDNDGKHTKIRDDEILFHQSRFGKYDTTVLINSIYTTCRSTDIEPFFIATWDRIELVDEMTLTPDVNWLFGPGKTLIESAIDCSIYKETKDDPSYKNQELYEKYFLPCKDHPNIHGHEILADTVYESLSKKV